MYIIAIAWLYVALLAAIANPSAVGAVLTFIFFGLGPLALYLWLFGTPARRRAAARREKQVTECNDRAESERNQ